MTKTNQEIIDGQMELIPAPIRDFLLSPAYAEKLEEIYKRQKILIDQAEKLDTETFLVMLGLEPLADYVQNIQRELGLSEDRAKEIALDVSENIFKPIRESLKQMAGEDEEESETESTVRFTNSSEINLNRDQILREIEDPSILAERKKEIEIRPELELKTIPGQEVQTVIKKPEPIKNDIFIAKMTGPTVAPQEIVNVKPEIKLPEIKKRPDSGFDPYREPII